jgi:hypothetical protein
MTMGDQYVLRNYVGIAVLGVVALVCVGCSGGASGPALTPAKGKVTFKGEALAGATVNFVSSAGEVATGGTDASGAFSLTTRGKPGAAPGDYKVTVVKSAAGSGGGPTSGPKPEDMFKMASKKGGNDPAAKSELPGKYADAQKSGLSATVSTDASKNDFKFDLSE